MAGQSAFATDRHWSGSSGTTWGTSGNWDTGVPGSTDNAVFDGTFSNQPSVGSSASVGGIWMTTGIGQNVTISGSQTLTMYGNTINGTSGLGILVDNSNAFTLTISANLTLQNAQTWRNNSGNLLTISGTVNTNNKGLTIDGSGNTTISGTISNNGPITKSGSGTLTLSGANSNNDNGATTVNDGTLQLNMTSGKTAFNGTLTVGDGVGAANSAVTRWLAASQVPTNTAFTINTDGLMDLNGFSDTVGSLTMTGGSITTGAGTLTLNGNVTGNASSTTATISGNLALGGSDRTFTTTNGTAAIDMNVSAAISGSHGVVKAGTGTLELSGANTYTGSTTVSAGILNIQNGAALGTTASGTTVSSGATLQLQNSITVGAEALTISGTGASGQNGALVNVSGTNNYGGLLTLGAATTISSDSGTLNLTNTGTIVGGNFALTLAGSGNGTISSIIGTTTSSLTKSGSGTWTLSGANTYTGTTAVNGGTLSTGTFTITPTGTVTIASGATYSTTGTLNLTPSASSGSTLVTGSGTLQLANASSSASTPDLYYDPTGGAGSGYGVTIASGVNVSAGTHYINGLSDRNDYERYGGDLIFSGALTGSGNLNFTGTPNTGGTNPPYQMAYTLQGNNSSFSGGITLSGGGNLIVDNANALTSANAITFTPGSGSVAGLYLYGTNVTIGALSGTAAGSMYIRNGSLVTDSNSTINPGIVRANATLTVQQNTNTTFNGIISDGPNDHGTGDSGTYYTLALVKSGTGALTLGGTNTYTGGTAINGGTLVVSGSANLGAISGGLTINAGTLEVATGYTTTRAISLGDVASTFQIDSGQTFTDSTAISGSGSLTKTGSGTMVLGTADTYTGSTTVSAGTLQVNANNSLGTTTNGTIVSSGAALKLNAVNYSSTEALTLNGSGISNGGALVNSGTSTYAGTITAATNATINAGGGTLTLTGGVVKNGTTLTIAGGGTVNINTNGISGSSANSDLVIDGTTVVLNTANSYNGPTTIQNSGTLQLGASNVLPSSPQTAMTINTSSIFNMASYSDGVASLAGDGTGTVKNNVTSTTSTLTVNPGTGVSSTFSGVIAGTSGGTQGNIALVKSGAGTLTLAGTNTYTGTTTVNAGSLFVNGSTASGSAITVNNSGTILGGSGTINGTVNVASSGAVLAPGATGVGSTAILHTGALTLASGSNLKIDINGSTAGSGYDQIISSGSISLTGATLVVSALPSMLALGNKYYIVEDSASSANTYGLFSNGTTVTDSSGDVFSINYADNGDGGLIPNDISLTVTLVVPEVSTVVTPTLVTVTLLIYHLIRKRRRRINSLSDAQQLHPCAASKNHLIVVAIVVTVIGSNPAKADLRSLDGSENEKAGRFDPDFELQCHLEQSFGNDTTLRTHPCRNASENGVTDVSLTAIATQSAAHVWLASDDFSGRSFKWSGENVAIQASHDVVTFNLWNLKLSDCTLTLEGTATTQFIINVQHRFSITNTSSIVLSGGVQPLNVVFNVLGPRGHVLIDNQSTLTGSIVAQNRTVIVNDGSTVFGNVTAAHVNLINGGTIQPPPVVSQ